MSAIYFLILLVCLANIGWMPNALAEAHVCTKEEAIEAESLSTAQSWGQLHQQFKNYAHCDDGAIGEGFSESVSLLLADHWQDIDQLEIILKSDFTFRKFVMRHINETVPVDRLERIQKNVGRQCPRKLKKLCRDIALATSYTIQESK